MTGDGAPDRYGVVGHPVAHSLSPLIHRRFAAQTGQSLDYTAIDVLPESFERDLEALFANGIVGLNVTVPHKRRAAELCDALTPRARRAGAVNTLARRDGHTLGDTTDGEGLVRDLTRHLGLELRGASILVVGAGGSVYTILGDLLGAQPGAVVIANRTRSKAERAAATFAAAGPVRACGLDDIPGLPYDLVVNATSASLAGAVPAIAPETVHGAHGYDLMYAAGGTAFTAWCLEHGARAVSTGVGMLIEQAALSFEIWRGVRPETAGVRRLLATEHGLAF